MLSRANKYICLLLQPTDATESYSYLEMEKSFKLVKPSAWKGRTTEPTTEPPTKPPTEPPATDDPLDTFDFVEELRNLEYCTIYNITVKSEGFNATFGASQTLFTIDKTGQPPEIDGPEEVSIYEVDTTSVVVSWYRPVNNHRCIHHYEVIWENGI